MPSLGSLLRLAAPDLAASFFDRGDAAGALPLWADGGDGGALPAGHVFAALPDRVDRIRVEDLPFRGLVPWLRDRLGAAGGAGDGRLRAVLLAYDAGRNLERIPSTALEDPPLPDVVVARYPAWLESAEPGRPFEARAVDPASAERLAAWLEEPPSALPHAPLPRSLESRTDRAAYGKALAEVLRAIGAGDLYQANVARRLEAPCDPEAAWALHLRLRAASPAAFGLLWRLGPDLAVSSISPECLLEFDPRTREARSLPIKGTRPRHPDPEADRALAAELGRDEKERAEHLMIVDLVRNDLGRVAVPGTVRVEDLFGVHALPTVHHMVSTVRAKVREDVDLAEVLGALFPGGSVTGAPKIAAMAKIEEVEGLRRGFYTGSFGLVRPDGRATFDILIRTAVLAGGRLLYPSGGGIVADSDPDREWEETEVKALALVRALRGR